MAAMRWIAAGGLLITLLALRGERLPARREWPSLAILGILLLGFGNGAVVWAEQTVPSGLTAVLVATSPFWMVGIDALMPDGEAITLRRLLGLVVGFGGIVMLVWPEIRFDGGGGGFLGGVIAAQIACVGWAVGSSYARKRGRGHASGGERARDRGVRDAVRRDRAADRVARAARDRAADVHAAHDGRAAVSDLRRRDRRASRRTRTRSSTCRWRPCRSTRT